MHIRTTVENGRIHADVAGRFDAHTVDGFFSEVTDAVSAERPDVVLDLAAVEFMDSSALAALVTTLKRCVQHGGEVVLAAVSDPVRIILELTRLDQIFPATVAGGS